MQNIPWDTIFESKNGNASTNYLVDKIDKLLDENELFDALQQLKDNKSPGPDGLTKEFYVKFWDDLKVLYLKCIDNIFQKGELTEMQKRGAIKTVFKKGDRTRITKLQTYKSLKFRPQDHYKSSGQ